MEQAQPNALGMIKQYFLDFGVLRDNPREFWAVQTVNFLDMLAFWTFMNISTVFLSGTLGWDDVGAGYVFTAFSMLVTISLFFTGFLTDTLGIRKALLLSMVLLFVGRGGIAVCGLWEGLPQRAWVAVPFFLLCSPAVAMTQTLYQAANKRFSSKRSRSASFNCWYLAMNLGAMAAGYTIDLVRLKLGLPDAWIYALGACTSVLSFLVALSLVRRETQVVGEGETPEPEPASQGPRARPWAIFKSIVHQPNFWRFMVLMVSVLGVRAAILYFPMLMPKYWMRVIGEGVEMGFLQSINPTIIIFGIVLTIPLAHRFKVFNVLVMGATVAALSLFILVLPWSWFGPDPATGYLRMAIWMAVLNSLGELFWSPKLQEFTAAIAPRGQEGSYYGLSMMPWFFAKLVVSSLSGHMLARFCPEGIGDRIRAGGVPFWESPEAMWLLLFLWALLGPILALVLARWLTRGTEASEKAVQAPA